mmetsp:Transcript_30128/g.70269  ORF Transcript_30128/g.70269 Transcript_30128/m.70269 type:complete len:367 (-) Transcript_30128:121-1221(-)
MASIAVVELKTRPGSIKLLGDSDLLAQLPQGANGVVNICVESPADGISLSVNENADPDVRVDHIAAIAKLHRPPAAAQSLLFKKSVTLPCKGKRLHMGTWQGVYVIDLREKAMEVVKLRVTLLPSQQREEFTVTARARDATQLEEEVAKRMVNKKRPATGNESVTDASSHPGAVLVHEMHTSASLSVGSGNLEPVMNDVVPEAWHYEFFTHTMEGVDDMTAHLKCSMLGCSAVLPLNCHGSPLCPVRLNEHRYAGGYGIGHQRRVLVDRLVGPADKDSFFMEVNGLTDLGAEIAGKQNVCDLMNISILKGEGGLLMGSRSAVEAYEAPNIAVMPQSLEWPAELATASGMQLWYTGGAASVRVTPIL